MAGLRLITYDRPGYAASTVHLDRTLLSDVADVESLLDALEIPRVALLAFSGGAAVGYACAAMLGDRVSRLGVLSGATWPTGPPPADTVLRTAATALRGDTDAAVAALSVDAPQMDLRALADPSIRRRLHDGVADAFATGIAGWITEARLIRSPWPFAPVDVQRPVMLWHGADDEAVPIDDALSLAQQLPDATIECLPNPGHLGWLEHETDIVRIIGHNERRCH